MIAPRWLMPLLLTVGTVQAGGGVTPPPSPSMTDCLKVGDSLPSANCRWQTASGTVNVVGDPSNSELRLSAYDRAGQWLWTEKKVSFIQRIQVLGGVLVISTSNNGIGAYITTHTALISPKLKRPVWVWGTFLVHSAAAHQALFTQEDVRAPQEEDGLNFQRAVLTPEIRLYPVHFPSPSRPDCGPAEGFYEQFGQPKFTARHIYVERQDKCGRFMTRFDWVNPEAAPLISPVK